MELNENILQKYYVISDTENLHEKINPLYIKNPKQNLWTDRRSGAMIFDDFEKAKLVKDKLKQGFILEVLKDNPWRVFTVIKWRDAPL
jgi:hypothetical protein